MRCGPSIGGTLGGFTVFGGGCYLLFILVSWGVWGTLGGAEVCSGGGAFLVFFWASSEKMSLSFWMACSCRSPRAS